MVDRERLQAKVREQAEKTWDVASITAWLNKVAEEGVPSKGISHHEAVGRKLEVLDLVQRQAEDCTFVGRI